MTKAKTAATGWSYTGGPDAVIVNFSSGPVEFKRGQVVEVDAKQAAVLTDHPDFEPAGAATTPTPTPQEA
jgi:hypothetical protein